MLVFSCSFRRSCVSRVLPISRLRERSRIAEELDKGLASLGLTRAQLQQAQLEAFQWVGHL